MARHFKEPVSQPEPIPQPEPTPAPAPAPLPEQTLASEPVVPQAVPAYPATRVAAPRPAPAPDPEPAPAPRRRRRGARDLFSTLLIVVGVVLLAIAGGMWGTAQFRYHQQDQVNKKLAAYATIDETPNAAQSGPPQIDWAGLKAINDEVCGWLQVPGTTINYPVYQASDNDKYLRHSATGEWTWGGQLFLDFECTNPGMVDQVTLIYGHHLNDGSMFEQIARMDEQERFDAIQTVWYVTEANTYELEPLFLYYTQEDDPDARTFTFADNDEFRDLLAHQLSRAVTFRPDAGNILATTEHVLVLATCNYIDGYGRSLLVCVPKKEAAPPAQTDETGATEATGDAGDAVPAETPTEDVATPES